MKKISLGYSDFKTIIDKGSYFVDKSLLIKEFLEDESQIRLLPRPRRYNKKARNISDYIPYIYFCQIL